MLQRDQPLPVWGWTSGFATVRVSLGGHVAIALSNAEGDFLVRLPPLPAGGPHTLSVTVAEANERWEAHDILIGEVWLASGQSNMEWPLANSLPLTAQDAATADFPGIRFFTVPTRAHLGPDRTVEGAWQACAPATVGSFSAVAFSFARRLHRELGVPVGVIASSWGGSNIQSWISRSTLALNSDMQAWLAGYENEAWSEARWALMNAPDPDGRVSSLPRDPGNTGLGQNWHLPDFDDSGWPAMDIPRTWQSAGHPNSGVFWFRRRIEIPDAWIGRELLLHLGAVDKQDITYVNGIEVGRTGKDREEVHWNLPRTYTVPAAAVLGHTLTIAVRVYSFIYDGGLIGPAPAMGIHPGDDPSSRRELGGDWRYCCEHDFGHVTEAFLLGHGERNSPHILFDNMIQPLVPYALRGAIWYQGEGNAPEHEFYARLMRDLIQDWRRQWGLPDLAFHLVQLPNFTPPKDHQPESNWARLREAQSDALSLPNVGMAVTIDLGEADNIHPKNKMPVGERLAQSALALTYGRNVAACGPIAEKFLVESGAIRCHFRHAETGLTTTDGAPLRLFFVAGEDRVFYPAQARIEQSTVVVRHPAVPQPVAVRYAWANNPEGCSLANGAGLPTSPFRSDRW
ncbi:MAG: sialate O-acetylesterase [Phycisphaerales bacterium]